VRTKVRQRLISISSISSWTIQLFCLFLLTDFIFIILHLSYYFAHSFTAATPSYLYALDKDRTYSEIFQYIKEYWSALLLAFLAVRNRSILYLILSLLFFYLLLDDAIQIHETLGELVSTKFGFASIFNLRSVDLGELLVSTLIGLFFLSSVVLSFRFGDRTSRKASKILILLLILLAVFGVAADLLHIVVRTFVTNPFITEGLVGGLEDGGELLVMSAIASFIFEVAHQATLSKPKEMPLETAYDRTRV
jgi:hypothetical protein